MNSVHRTLALCLAAVATGALAAQDPACTVEVAAHPASVVEGEGLTVGVRYDVGDAPRTLHAELKNPANIVTAGQTAEVRGAGERTFTFTAPEAALEPAVTVAFWVGEEWTRSLSPIVHTPVIRVLSIEERDREEKERAAVDALLTRIAYVRSDVGNVAILDDDVPGQNRELVAALDAALTERGVAATRLSAEEMANPFLVTRERFDMVVLVSPEVFPADCLSTVARFAEAGGHLVVLGGPAFRSLVWRVGDEWISRDDLHVELAERTEARTFLGFEEEDLTQWTRGASTDAPSRIEAERPGAAGTAGCMHLAIRDYSGWDTFESPVLESPFAEGEDVTFFWAKGDGTTPQLSVEWREADGSRWIAVTPLTTEWRRYALRPKDFRYWQDSRAPGRGGAGDAFRPANAQRLVFGLAATHTNAVGAGNHEIWIDEVGCAAAPPELTALIDRAASASPPVIEGVSPQYKLYPVEGAAELRPTAAGAEFWPEEPSDAPEGLQAIHPRPQGTGYLKGRRWRWLPLVEVVRDDGRRAGWSSVLIANGAGPGAGGLTLSVAITDPEYYRRAGVTERIADVALRMLDGVLLYEGGSEFYAYEDGETVRLGAEVASFGRAPADAEVRMTVRGVDGEVLTSSRQSVSVAAGERTTVEAQCALGRTEATDFTVTTELWRDGAMVDHLQHPLTIWRPSPNPEFTVARDGDLWIGDRKWYAHGVNYMPSSGIGIEDGGYFEQWLGAQPYDPDVIEWDLAECERIGLNCVSVFIYHQSIDARNLWDFLIRCERHGLKVNLSLRPGTPMAFRWDEMRALIERHRLAESDTVFAYDLAWEPFFGGYAQRSEWDSRWGEWVVARHGSIEAAETDWGFPIPRTAEGAVTGPSDDQVAGDGDWRKMAVDYRYFVDDLLTEKYGEARRLVRSVDPNHLVSFRMTVAGDPTCGQHGFPYDLRGLANAVDLMEPEGYGRIGDWERVKPGWFTVAYSRAVAPDLPVVWAEFGWTIWDHANMKPSPSALEFETKFYTDFLEMALRSGSNGTICWWFPGGFRVNENSDFGIINPDRSWRGCTHVLREYAERMTTERDIPEPDVWIEIDRENHPDGIQGIYREVQERFWEAVDAGKTPGLRWVGR